MLVHTAQGCAGARSSLHSGMRRVIWNDQVLALALGCVLPLKGRRGSSLCSLLVDAGKSVCGMRFNF